MAKYIWDKKLRKVVPYAEKSLDSPLFHIVEFKSGFNHALGKYIGNSTDLRAAKSEYRERTGSELVEIGNERIQHRPQRVEYEVPRGWREQIGNG